MNEHLQIWPQITVLCLLAVAWIRCLTLHGKPVPEDQKTYHAGKFTLGLLLVVILLGNGGFWKPLGW